MSCLTAARTPARKAPAAIDQADAGSLAEDHAVKPELRPRTGRVVKNLDLGGAAREIADVPADGTQDPRIVPGWPCGPAARRPGGSPMSPARPPTGVFPTEEWMQVAAVDREQRCSDCAGRGATGTARTLAGRWSMLPGSVTVTSLTVAGPRASYRANPASPGSANTWLEAVDLPVASAEPS